MSAVPAPRPCISCPYRRDVAPGVWADEEYAKLPPYDEVETAAQPPQAFYCHQQDGRLCAGWVACHDMEESFGLRLAASLGGWSREEVEAIWDYTTDVPCSRSGRRLPSAAARDRGAPPEAVKLIQRWSASSLERVVDIRWGLNTV